MPIKSKQNPPPQRVGRGQLTIADCPPPAGSVCFSSASETPEVLSQRARPLNFSFLGKGIYKFTPPRGGRGAVGVLWGGGGPYVLAPWDARALTFRPLPHRVTSCSFGVLYYKTLGVPSFPPSVGPRPTIYYCKAPGLPLCALTGLYWGPLSLPPSVPSPHYRSRLASLDFPLQNPSLTGPPLNLPGEKGGSQPLSVHLKGLGRGGPCDDRREIRDPSPEPWNKPHVLRLGPPFRPLPASRPPIRPSGRVQGSSLGAPLPH